MFLRVSPVRDYTVYIGLWAAILIPLGVVFSARKEKNVILVIDHVLSAYEYTVDIYNWAMGALAPDQATYEGVHPTSSSKKMS